MGEPSVKSRRMEKFLDEQSVKLFGRGRVESIKSDVCVTCGGEAKTFKDVLSQKEFGISGLCQKCQDATFREEGEENG